MTKSPVTLGELIDHVAPNGLSLEWPPDVFAVVASVLRRWGGYTSVIDPWPPRDPTGAIQSQRVWANQMESLGLQWRQAVREKQPPPQSIVARWKVVDGARTTAVRALEREPVGTALLELVALADEACAGVGVSVSAAQDSPSSASAEGPAREATTAYDQFDVRASRNLLDQATLCRDVDASRVRVLPKLHTPQSGLTIRSLSHHLALCMAGEVEPQWYRFPGGPLENRLNVLLVPWPKTISPKQFVPLGADGSADMPERFGLFEFQPAATGERTCADAKRLVDNAGALMGHIDMVVFPECSLTGEQYDCLRKSLLDVPGRFLVSGVAKDQGMDRTNCVRMSGTYGDASKPRELPYDAQHKHHRWQMTRSQVIQYGLGGALDPMKSWWEYIGIRERTLSFVSINEWLTMCVLICEDLARQDPVAEIVRAVGPNLVIALLMDGPQLKSRWPARYATVLADDPGSSVLTLTSLGMTQLSCPPGLKRSRAVGLWKDARLGEAVELELPEGADGLILSIAVENYEEWTADGRSDGGTSGYPILAGLHPISVDQPEASPWT